MIAIDGTGLAPPENRPQTSEEIAGGCKISFREMVEGMILLYDKLPPSWTHAREKVQHAKAPSVTESNNVAADTYRKLIPTGAPTGREYYALVSEVNGIRLGSRLTGADAVDMGEAGLARLR